MKVQLKRLRETNKSTKIKLFLLQKQIIIELIRNPFDVFIIFLLTVNQMLLYLFL